MRWVPRLRSRAGRDRSPHVLLEINGVAVEAMVDTGATHSVMAGDILQKLRLKMTPRPGEAQGTAAQKILGVAENVPWKILVEVGSGSSTCWFYYSQCGSAVETRVPKGAVY